MPPNKKTVIEPTTNPDDFSFCAGIMSHANPWVKLGMDHAQCLKSFEGSFREVFILKNGKEINGS